jgi:hypothetical protein
MGGKRTLALGRKLEPLEQRGVARVVADRIEERIALESEMTNTINSRRAFRFYREAPDLVVPSQVTGKRPRVWAAPEERRR